MTTEEQIKFCQDRRLEWEPTTTSPGEVGMMARKNVAMYQAIETTLTLHQKLADSIEAQYRIIHGEPEVKEEQKAKSVEQRIRDKTKAK